MLTQQKSQQIKYPTTKSDYDFKKFKIMNIRTGEVLECDTASYHIDEIMKILLDSKLRLKEELTDEQFIENCKFFLDLV